MKYLILFIISICYSLTLFSQYEKINWLFFIDGKIPNSKFSSQDEDVLLEGDIICFEGTNKEKIIKFDYIIGDIKIAKTDIDYINENIEDLKNLTVKLYYNVYHKEKQTLYIYSFKIPSRLLFEYSYVVMKITNINKKKGVFYFDYYSDYEETVRIRSAQNLFNVRKNVKYNKFVTSSNEVMMKEVGTENRMIMICGH